ncbi:MAG TPA: VIT domain-containing protein [Gemmatimonadales bacterium]|nr:VIT domain-containing protein [Gemmatimonadales bacterium]
MKSLYLLAFVALTPLPLAAQGWIEPPPDRPVNGGVVRVRTEVSVRVVGRVANVEVEEWFQNRGAGLGEGDYLYPLPGEAVFSNFSLFQGDQELRGETMDAARARQIYEEIVRRKKDPALIELAGHGLIRARVFPINQGETRKITLRYSQMLRRAGDAVQFKYAAAGRHGGRSQTEGAVDPLLLREPAPLNFTLVADSGAQFRDPFSPTHELRVDRTDGRLTVRPQGELSGDFALFLPLARGLVGMSLVAHRPTGGEPGYFMLTLSPEAARGDALQRDLTVVLDVSGSMSGAKIEQARRALHQLLSSLGARDRFRLITFASTVTTYRPDWTAATDAELREARRWVDGITATGGTNIADALTEAFRAPSPEGRLPIVLFLTDGLPSVGEQNPERLAQRAEQARGRSRVFAFGVGYDVNTYLLDRLTAAGRGTTQYVEPGEDVEAAVGGLAAKISHPVLGDLAIGETPARFTEIYPTRLPDLFAGEELVIFGRYEAAEEDRTGTLGITGRRAGREERFSVNVMLPAHATGDDYIPRLWAARKIGALQQSIRLNGHNAEVEREIRETALRYGLLSEYTSYLVQEPLDVAQDGRRVLMRAMPARVAAPAPNQAFGQASVRAAEQDRARREVASKAALDADEGQLAARVNTRASRGVSGRVFLIRNGVWTDATHGEAARVVKIAAFSDAYFALLRRLPELEPWWREFDRVLVAGPRISIEIGPSGETTLSAARLEDVARAFRGR